MRSVALITYDKAPDLTDDDRLLIEPLKKRGIEARPAVWSDPAVGWASFDLAVLRSTWDYHLRFAEFEAWLARLEQLNVPVLNPLPLARWNSRKTYLRDLESRGATVVPTVWIGAGSGAIDVPPEWADDLVMKPVVSADGHETWRLRRSELPAYEERIHQSGAMIQPFCREIVEEGEWSLIFIDGAYSHAILKKPAPGEFRVQETWGGGPHAAEASPALIRAASRAMEAVGAVPLYARVDGVRRGDELLLIELELIEPALYLEFGPGSAERLAEAIAGRM